MSAPSARAIRVLHVDDEPGFAEMAGEFLKRLDDRVEVQTETSVNEALDKLRETSVHCVVSDYDMPGQNGVEFLEAVRQDYPNLPFILYTGKGSEEVAGDAIAAGVTEYLQKEAGTGHFELLFNRIENAVEQRRAKQIAEATEHRLQTLAENTNDILWMFDGDWSELQFINSPYEEIWGRSMDELRTRPQSFLDGIHPDDRDLVRSAMAQLSAGESIDVEYRVNADENFGRWVWVQGEPVFDHAEEVVQVVGFARDITERIQRERELTENQSELQLYEHVVENSTDLLAAVDTEYSFLIGNDRYLRYHGLSRDDIGHRSLPDVLGDEWEAGVKEHIDKALAGEEVQYEMVREGADGAVRWFDLHNYPIRDGNGTVRGTAGAMRDITDLKTREEELQRQNKRLDEFVNVVSHDLRNPLSVARGRLELARADGEREDLEAVAAAHDRMERLIEDLLELATAGTLAPNLQRVRLADVVERSQRYLESAATTTVNVSELEVYADRNQLELLVGNLISNAVEHGGADVTITVGDLPDGWFIEDDGPGVPVDRRGQVFDSGFTTKTDGTGFGLDVVKQVVDAHEWNIRLVEGAAGGARFEITDVDTAD